MHERRHRNRIVAFVMAGGEGSRLQPLTTERCKPAVPFGSRYRIIDFVLSNLINSDIRSIYLLVQYKPQELIEHIRKAWVISPLLTNQFVTVVPPQMHGGQQKFAGTADAVYQSLRLIETHQPDIVAVFGADHIYRMDIQQMLHFHRDRDADVTVAALPVPLEQAHDFGVIDSDASGRIREFQEKPPHPKAMPSNPRLAYASMGNYLFNTDVLLEALKSAHAAGETDFGKHVLPRLLQTHRLYTYDFASNEVPGIKPYEEKAYWRDVGNIDAYVAATRDVLGEEPRFDAFNPHWPIYSSSYQGPVARINGGDISNTLIGAASVIHKGARLTNCIIRREVVVEEDAQLDNCIIMDYSRIGRGARLSNVIVDRHNLIEAGSSIGQEIELDRTRYHVTPGGIVVLARGRVDYFARETSSHGSGYSE